MTLPQKISSHFAGKTCFIVGGSEGIGFAAAQALVTCGARVTILSRSEDKLRNAVATVQAQKSSRGTIDWRVMDVTHAAETQQTCEGLMAAVGVPDIVINCAGIAHPGYLETLAPDALNDMMAVNVLGTMHVCRAVLPALQRKGGGIIVNTSSLAGFMGLFGYTGYCASKFAVIGFSEALRRELAPYRVHVGVLCPPNTTTPGLLRENAHKPPEVLATEEKVKVLSASEVATALLHGIYRRQVMIIPTWDGKIAYVMSRYCPGLLGLFLRRPHPAKATR